MESYEKLLLENKAWAAEKVEDDIINSIKVLKVINRTTRKRQTNKGSTYVEGSVL